MVGLRNVPGNGSDYQASWRAVRVFGFPVSQSAMEVGAIVGSADGGVGIHRGSKDTSQQTCVMHTGVVTARVAPSAEIGWSSQASEPFLLSWLTETDALTQSCSLPCAVAKCADLE